MPLRQQLQSVQLFRGAAVLLVLLFHATVISKAYLGYDLLGGLFLFGYSGVDIFFVLSGFIIFLKHRDDANSPKSLKPYFQKRFIRIYPLYWVIALALVPIYFAPAYDASYCIVLFKSLLLLPQVDNPVVTVAWSLSQEVFFYGMFALAIFFPWRYVRPVFVGCLLVTAVFYVGKITVPGTFEMPPHSGFFFSPYNLEFAMGCLAAHLLDSLRPLPSAPLVITGLAMFLLCGINDSSIYARFGRNHSILSYGIASMLMILGGVLWERRRRRAMPSMLLLMGDASYSIYLTHYALLDLFLKGALALAIPALIGSSLTAVLATASSLGIGVLLYLGVERPLLTYLRKRIGARP